MRVETPSTLLQMGENSIPEAIRGFVQKVYPVSQGVGPNGSPWQLQKLIISDPSGAQIEAMFSDRDAVQSNGFIGTELYAVCTNGQRGLQGIKRKNNKQKGTPQVFIYRSADVSFTSQNGHIQQPPQQQQGFQQPQHGFQQQQFQPQQRQQGGYSGTDNPTYGNSQPPPQQTQQRQGWNGNGQTQQRQQAPQGYQQQPTGNGQQQQKQEPPKLDPDEERLRTMKVFNVALGKNCAAYNRCFDAVVSLVKEVNARHADFFKALGVPFAPTSDGLKEMATALLIQVSRSQDGLISSKYFPLEEFGAAEAKIEEKRAKSQPPQQQGQPSQQFQPPQGFQQPPQQFQQPPQGAPFN